MKIKKLLSLILVLSMMLPCIPVGAWAEEGEEATLPVCICDTACGGENGIRADCPVCVEDFENCTHFVPACTCAEKCSADARNTNCPVCGAEGAAACTGAQAQVTYAASGTCGENATWVLDENGLLTISGTGPMSFDTRPWEAYAQNEIHSVIINEGITTVCTNAFYRCDYLESVSLPTSLHGIENNVFEECSRLKQITIPDGVMSIGHNAFYRSGLQNELILPENLITMGADAFADCTGLTGVTIPEGVTGIGAGAFQGCTSLKRITIPDSVTYLNSAVFRGCSNLTEISLPDTLKTIEIETFAGTGLTGITIPEGVSEIGDASFSDCKKLSTITIPASVTKLGAGLFLGCDALQSITFAGSAPSVEPEPAFWSSADRETVTAYYPAGDATWTASVRSSYGDNIVWATYESGGGGETVKPEDPTDPADPTLPEKPAAPACRLADLQPADYVAFSHIAYLDWTADANGTETIQQILTRKGKWNASMQKGETDITYGQLCARIASWRPCSDRENAPIGFYAVAFVNDSNEVVLAYRGSESLAKLFSSHDAQSDWLKNDLPTIIFDEVAGGNQFATACSAYNAAVSEMSPSAIVLTGHSLGGGLADLVAARYGCRAESANAISVLGAFYYKFPEEMGRNFQGVDSWDITDHANESDIAAGVYEKNIADVRIKPYIAYKNLASGSLIGPHSLHTYIQKNSDGTVSMTAKTGSFRSSVGISERLNSVLGEYLYLGTGKNDTYSSGLKILAKSIKVFGGNGSDSLTTGQDHDTLIGGSGTDYLDGGRGNDTYIYYKGSGIDNIYDIHGDDKLCLLGFSSGDKITYTVEDNGSSYVEDYICVKCNGETIVQINKSCRAYSVYSPNSFKIYVGDSLKHDISKDFKTKLFQSRVEIACPVSIEILDADGNVVYTLEDGVPGNYYTEYGNFYVYDEGNGQYGKVLDLAEGYSIRIVGTGSGTMDITYYALEDGGISGEAQTMTDIPVTDGYVAQLEETSGGTVELKVTEAPHSHSWNAYHAEGNVITEGCTCGASGGTLTITKPYLTTYGMGVDAEANLAATENFLFAYTDVPVRYTKDGQTLEAAPTDAGSYTASITIGGATASVDYTIGKAQPRVMLAPDALFYSYDGQMHPLVTAGSVTGGSFRYQLGETGQWSEAIPQASAAGDYTVYWMVAGDANHNDVTGDSVSARINPGVMTGIQAANVDVPYDGQSHCITVTGADTIPGAVITYSTDNATYTATHPVIANVADSRTVFYKVEAEGYRPFYGLASVTIRRAQIQVSGITAQDKIFDNNVSAQLDCTNAVLAGKVEDDDLTVIAMGRFRDANAGENKPVDILNLKLEGSSKANYTLAPSGQQKETTATITKAPQEKPTGVTAVAETIHGRSDGKLQNLSTAMEYRKETDEAYEPVTAAELTGLAAGNYHIRYKAKPNYSASEDLVVAVEAGRKLAVTLPADQTGYTLTANAEAVSYNGSVMLTFRLAQGYSAGSDFALAATGGTLTKNEDGTYTVSAITEDVFVTVAGVQDVTAPTAQIEVSTSKWTSFLNTITFDLFFKQNQTATITAADAGSGVEKIEYLLSETALTLEQVKAVSSWLFYKEPVSLETEQNYLIYAKVTDKAGNTLYINSNGMILDKTLPVISGIANGAVYYTTQAVTAADTHLETLQLDGAAFDGTIPGDPDQQTGHSVTARDKAGNTTTFSITMKPVAVLNEGLPTAQTLELEDEAAIRARMQTVSDILLRQCVHATSSEKRQLQTIKNRCAGMLQQIENVEKVIALINAMPAASEVEPDDEDAIRAYDAASAAYSALTEQERKMVDAESKNKLNAVNKSLTAYEVIARSSSTYTQGSKKTYTVTANGYLGKFTGLKIDDKAVKEKNYKAESGSVIVTLNNAYLDTLSTGSHTITFLFTDGSTDGEDTFKIVKSNGSSETADNSHVLFFGAVFLISLLALITLVVVIPWKKRKYQR